MTCSACNNKHDTQSLRNPAFVHLSFGKNFYFNFIPQFVLLNYKGKLAVQNSLEIIESNKSDLTVWPGFEYDKWLRFMIMRQMFL